MPRAFNLREQDAIRASLKKEGARLFRAKGALKTTVDELGRAAGIAKGSFYKFYDSKEVLYFEILEDVHLALRASLVEDEIRPRTRAEFERRLQKLIKKICNEPLIMFMARHEEFQAVLRRVPPEQLRAHEKLDRAFIEKLIETWATRKTPPTRGVVAARLSTLLLICFRQDFMGARLFKLGIEGGIESLANCLFKQ